jgi:hypothetical protein
MIPPINTEINATLKHTNLWIAGRLIILTKDNMEKRNITLQIKEMANFIMNVLV